MNKNKRFLILALFIIIMSSLIVFSLANAQQIIVNNPLDPTNKKDIGSVWVAVVKTILGFIGVASLVVFIYAGFTFLISAGNAEKTRKAKDTIIYAVLGIFLAMAAYAILSFVFSTIEGAI